MTRFFAIVFLCLASLLLPACQGDRWSSVIDESSSEGRWRPDGVLIRSYNVTLSQGADAALTLAGQKRWLVLSDSRGERSANIHLKTRELVDIRIHVWAPANKATEIGIAYADGNRAGAIRLFEDIERILPRKRITVNQPQ